jgi:hypothetical protein
MFKDSGDLQCARPKETLDLGKLSRESNGWTRRLTLCSVFQTPWQSVVASTESLADSHNTLAVRLQTDVERPLREYQTKDREMQRISTMQGNLGAMAKELEEAQKKVEKAQGKGGEKASSAELGLQTAAASWDSQAPFFFEQLQALDEGRVNHLRDVLTQMQTHEVDQLERSRVTAESTLNVLLNVNTADEISSFVARTAGATELPSLSQRRQSLRPGTSNTTSAPSPLVPPSFPPSTPTPSRQAAAAQSPSRFARTPSHPRDDRSDAFRDVPPSAGQSAC